MAYKIAILGEAWGVEEEKAQTPFIGYSGQELTRMLADAGIHRADCFLTNVFNLHPPGNDLAELGGDKEDRIEGYPSFRYKKEDRTTTVHIHRRYQPELDRLRDELLSVKPNVVITVGNTAMWAMMGKTAISKFRGVCDLSTHTAPGIKVLPTYHPMAVLQQYSLRPTVVIDLTKAKRESEFPELRRPHREVWIEPTLEDLETFYDRYLVDAGIISIDIETSGALITCVGMACGPGHALVVPFFDGRRKDRSYWKTHEAELSAWLYVQRVLDLPNRKLFQNGLYDIAFLWRSVGLRVRNAAEDTMLLHHALQPEALKSLGYLGSIYTDEGAWKQMRGSTKTIKRDE